MCVKMQKKLRSVSCLSQILSIREPIRSSPSGISFIQRNLYIFMQISDSEYKTKTRINPRQKTSSCHSFCFKIKGSFIFFKFEPKIALQTFCKSVKEQY